MGEEVATCTDTPVNGKASSASMQLPAFAVDWALRPGNMKQLVSLRHACVIVMQFHANLVPGNNEAETFVDHPMCACGCR